jgi:hypothetical protein
MLRRKFEKEKGEARLRVSYSSKRDLLGVVF